MSLFDETLRYLGWHGQVLDEDTRLQIESAMEACQKLALPRHVTHAFALERDIHGLRLSGTEVRLTGDSIVWHLRAATQVEVMAATLGALFDRELMRLSQYDPSRAAVLDAAATALIEDYCDRAEADLRAQHEDAGRSLLPRFSPGYGDFPLDIQPNLIALLNAERTIGLTCTPHYLLIPRKSVTAFMGVCDELSDVAVLRGCSFCVLQKTCNFSHCIREKPLERS